MSLLNRAREFYTGVNRYDCAFLRDMLEPDYIQHNPKVPSGREAFLDVVLSLKESRSRIENLAIFEANPYVIMLHKWTNAQALGGDILYGFHVLRFSASGLIAEHWSCLSKTLVRTNTLIPASLPNRVAPSDADNSSLLAQYLSPQLKASQGITYQQRQAYFYGTGHLFTVHQGLCHGSEVAIYDLLRWQSGPSAESFKLIQPVPKEDLANNNGMFGFGPQY